MSDKKYASQAETAARVDEIYEMMRMGEWNRGKSGIDFAAKHGISESRVKQLAAEAWRRVSKEADSPDEMRPEISGILRTNLAKADRVSNFRAIASLAETWSKIIGARAPERHEHAVVVAQFDALTQEGKIKWIEDRIAKLQEAKQALLSQEDIVEVLSE